MAWGVKIETPASELVISADSITFGYLGQATFVSTTQPGTSLDNSVDGYSVYTFDYAGQILVALPLTSSGSCILLGMSQSGTTWTITVHQGDGTTNAAGFDVETAPAAVYVFGMPIDPGGWGGNLYRADGSIACDLTRQPIRVFGRVQMASSVTSQALPTVTTPAIIGAPCDRTTFATASGVHWRNQYFGRAWKLSGSNVTRVLHQRERVLEDASAGAVTIIDPVNAILIEADGL